MVQINPAISMITLNVSGQTCQLKDRDCQNGGGKRNKTQLHAVYINLL